MHKTHIEFGPYYSEGYLQDVKKSMITLARYKFASKMLEYKENLKVLELGCNEGVGAYFFMQMANCDAYVGVDIDENNLYWANQKVKPHKEIYGKKAEFIQGDITSKEHIYLAGEYSAVICLDVIEHIDSTKENNVLDTITDNLQHDGVAVIGTPNLQMKQYQSIETQKVHVNMFDAERLYKFMNSRFKNVFIFGMNDEVVHTGFAPMDCYLFALCCNIEGGGVKQNGWAG